MDGNSYKSDIEGMPNTDQMNTLLTIMRHRENLADSLEELADELRRRARVHDRDKLELDKFHGFVKVNAAARSHAYGSPEYKAGLAQAKPTIDSHFAVSSHHPEYHKRAKDMGFLDIIEMVFDWDAAAKTYGTNSLRDSLPVSFERHDFSVMQIWLINQVVEWIERND